MHKYNYMHNTVYWQCGCHGPMLGVTVIMCVDCVSIIISLSTKLYSYVAVHQLSITSGGSFKSP